MKNSYRKIAAYCVAAALLLTAAAPTQAFGSDLRGEKNVSLAAASAPVIAESDIAGGVAVAITSAPSGDGIVYTLDGVDPTLSSAEYTAPFALTTPGTRVIKAAVADGEELGPVATKVITVAQTGAPAFSVPGGAYTDDTHLSVEIAPSTPGASIYYTTDGSEPTRESTLYTAPLTVDQSQTVKAIAVCDGMADSPVVEHEYYVYTYAPVKDAYLSYPQYVSAPIWTQAHQDELIVTATTVYLEAEVANGVLIDEGEHEFVYWPSSDPGNKTVVPAEGGNAKFYAEISGLTPNTEYYYLARSKTTRGILVGEYYTVPAPTEEQPDAVAGVLCTFTTSDGPAPAEEVKLHLSPRYLSLAAEEKFQLIAQVLPEGTPGAVTWSSSDESVATVTAGGKVTAVANGTAKIKAELNGQAVFCLVTVSETEFIHYNFSELNMVTNTSNYAPDGEGFTWDTEQDGGNNDIATAYLARWEGPVMEADDPYPVPYSSDVIDVTKYKNVSARYHVQNITFIPKRKSALDNDDVKAAVLKYGAVASSYISNESYYDGSKRNFYYPSSQAASAGDGGHAINIVGWDDNYAKENFTITPPTNGAFLCRNSWGTGVGDGGYFWISYYDKYLAIRQEGAVVRDLQSTSNYNTVYQYDPLGAVASYSTTQQVCAANVFPAQGDSMARDEILQAVAFYTLAPDTAYEVYIITDFRSKASLKEPGTLAASGLMKETGYHTVDLDTPILLKQGTRFAVMVKIWKPGDSVNERVSFATEAPVEGYSENARANAGESYYCKSPYGWSWLDLHGDGASPNTNWCIKAYTDNGQAASSAQLFDAIDNEGRAYESDKVYTVDELLAAGFEMDEDFVDYMHKKESVTLMGEGDLIPGDVPSPLKLGDRAGIDLTGMTLPTSCDLRESGLLTEIKNQNPWGTCWAHAACASTECAALRLQKTAGGIYAGEGTQEERLLFVSRYGDPVAEIGLSEPVLDLKPGDTAALYASALPYSADAALNYTWTSSDGTVATVSETGVVTAQSSGNAIVTATASNGMTASCVVTVSSLEPDVLQIDSVTLTEGEEGALVPTAALSCGTERAAVCYVAIYTVEGNQMVSVQRKTLSKLFGRTTVSFTPVVLSGLELSDCHAKCFLLDDDNKPLTECAVFPLPSGGGE